MVRIFLPWRSWGGELLLWKHAFDPLAHDMHACGIAMGYYSSYF